MARTKNIILLALLIRLSVIPFLYHPDLKTQYFHTQFLSKGVTNIYKYVYDNKPSLPYKDTFNYTPVVYYLQGIWFPVAKILSPPNLTSWLNNWGPNQNNYANLPWFILTLKIPYLVFDIGLGLYLLKRYKKNIAYLWLFNPITIYALYFHANYDIIPATLCFISIDLFLNTKKARLAGILFSLAVGIKLFPLLFLAIFIKQDKNKIINFSIASVSTLVLLFLFSNLFSPGWLLALTSSGLIQKIFELKFNNIPIFPVLWIITTIFFILKKQFKPYDYLSLTGLLFLSTITYHGQWIVWFLPFFLFTYSSANKYLKFLLIILILSFISRIILYNDVYMTWGHFLPLNTQLLNQSTPFEILSKKTTLSLEVLQNNIKYIQLIFLFIITFFYAKKNNNTN